MTPTQHFSIPLVIQKFKSILALLMKIIIIIPPVLKTKVTGVVNFVVNTLYDKPFQKS